MKSKSRSKRKSSAVESDVEAAANRRRRLEQHLIRVTENSKLTAKQREKAATALQRLLSASQPKSPEQRAIKISKLQGIKREALAALNGSPWDGLLAVHEVWVGELDGANDDD